MAKICSILNRIAKSLTMNSYQRDLKESGCGEYYLAEDDVSFKDKNGNSPSHIPEDLLNFIRRDTYSLLVKGFAGTGKTTLALTILNVLGIKNNFFYISTRLSPKQLFQYYPWLKDFVQQSMAHDTTLPRDREMMSTFEDARLDEPESLFER